MTSIAPNDDVAATTFSSPGEMAARCRGFDWAGTPLGPVSAWSQSLRTIVSTMLASRFPMFLWWGPELIQIFNDGYLPSFGTSGRDVAALGARGQEHWSDIWPVIGPQIEQVMTTGAATWHENHLVPIRRNDRLENVWWTYGYSPVRDDDGTIGGVLVVVQETTAHVELLAEREAARAAAEAERLRLHDLFRQAPAFIAVLRGLDFIFEIANDSYYQLVGHREIIGKPAFEALPEVRGQGFYELLRNVVETGETFVGREIPIMLQHTPGAAPEQRYLTFVYAPLTEPDGTRSGVFAHGVDVTNEVLAHRSVEEVNRELEARRIEAEAARDEAQRAVAALVTSEAQRATETRERTIMAATVAQCIDFVGIAAPDGRAIYINAAGRRLIGLTPDEAVNDRGILDFIASEWQDQVRDEYLPSLIRNGFFAGEVGFRHWTTGDTIQVEWHTFVVRDELSDNIVALACVARDLRAQEAIAAERARLLLSSEAARLEAEQARAAAESANRSKSEFLAAMSHELRTPLNAIAGYTQLIELGIHGPVTDAQREALDRIQRSEQHLLSLVNDVLNFAKMEAGRIEYDIASIPLAEVVIATTQMVEPQIRAKGLEYDVRIVPDLIVRADHEKLQQILLNLLSNAIKFSRPGSAVWVDVGQREDAPANVVYVRVCDTGIGIPREKHESIFDPFVQVNRDLKRPAEGTGLGLAISRDLARGMGGDLRVRSTLGKGSAFTITLPAVAR